MDRCIFFTKLTIDGVDELDHLWNSLSGFSMNYKPSYYRVDSSDILRPWLISMKCYGSVEFWWLLMVANNINNVFTDLVEGMIIQVPNRLDMYDFMKRNKVR